MNTPLPSSIPFLFPLSFPFPFPIVFPLYPPKYGCFVPWSIRIRPLPPEGRRSDLGTLPRETSAPVGALEVELLPLHEIMKDLPGERSTNQPTNRRTLD